MPSRLLICRSMLPASGRKYNYSGLNYSLSHVLKICRRLINYNSPTWHLRLKHRPEASTASGEAHLVSARCPKIPSILVNRVTCAGEGKLLPLTCLNDSWAEAASTTNVTKKRPTFHCPLCRQVDGPNSAEFFCQHVETGLTHRTRQKAARRGGLKYSGCWRSRPKAFPFTAFSCCCSCQLEAAIAPPGGVQRVLSE